MQFYQPQDARKHTTTPYVTGSSVVGIKFDGGVMLASDTLASYGSLARYVDFQRIKKIGDYTLVGASGELSDFQYIEKILSELVVNDFCLDDGYTLTPKEIYSYLTRVLYNRRSKLDPLWNQLVVAGHRDGEAFLGVVDLYGSSWEDDTVATGYGAYMAQPLLRKGYRPDLTANEAKKLLEDCLRVLWYRDARALNKIQVAIVTNDGVNISDSYHLDAFWDLDSAAPQTVD
eukprot:TRINITY_DN4099_c0_g1_i4.p1 TRINITY_DN4099_c0_g1~~TRINITY_DN4099_c0_g1_i4.p1  ORF type:complete len:231 (-),score=51.12 TRINITY_DN4099_c0_g1_i4:57-749(-)